jgi:two-component system, cell cycle response regulator
LRVLVAVRAEAGEKVARAVVSSQGHEAVCAGDGDTVWSVLRTSDAPELVLLDAGLPGLDWLELCRRIRGQESQVRPATYVVLLNASRAQAELVPTMQAGPDDCLIEPLEVTELELRLRAASRTVAAEADLQATLTDLRLQSTHDDLTGAWSRPAMLDALAVEVIRAQRDGVPLGVLMVDLDNFKEINDGHGHLAGDAVLREAAQRMIQVVRPYDCIGRYGGDEFVAILPRCSAREVLALAERLRQAVGSREVVTPWVTTSVTVSIGATCQELGVPATMQGLLHAADDALYLAKASGRNRAAFGRPDLGPGADLPELAPRVA